MSGASRRQRPGSCPRWRRPGRLASRDSWTIAAARSGGRSSFAAWNVKMSGVRSKSPARIASTTRSDPWKPWNQSWTIAAGRSLIGRVERLRRGEEEDADRERPGVERGSEHVLRARRSRPRRAGAAARSSRRSRAGRSSVSQYIPATSSESDEAAHAEEVEDRPVGRVGVDAAAEDRVVPEALERLAPARVADVDRRPRCCSRATGRARSRRRPATRTSAARAMVKTPADDERDPQPGGADADHDDADEERERAGARARDGDRERGDDGRRRCRRSADRGGRTRSRSMVTSATIETYAAYGPEVPRVRERALLAADVLDVERVGVRPARPERVDRREPSRAGRRARSRRGRRAGRAGSRARGRRRAGARRRRRRRRPR